MTPTASARNAFGLPTSELAIAADELARAVSPEVIYNHSLRSYLFAREIAAAGGLRADADYDDELVFVACVLHDLGATDHADGDQRFEVDGADAAALFLKNRGTRPERIKPVWNAIALHTTDGIAHRFGPVEAVCQRGIAADIIGIYTDDLSDEYAQRVHTAFPRHDVGYQLAEIVAAQVHRNPAKGSPLSFPAHLFQLHYPDVSPAVTWFDLVDGARWGDKRRRR